MSEELKDVEKQRPKLYGEIGITGLSRYSGSVNEEFLSQLRMAQGLKIYREMRDNDATIGAVLYVMEMLMRSVTWKTKEGGPASVDILARDFVKENISDMCMTWDNTLSDMLTMFTYGWSWHEISYKRRSGYNIDEVLNSEYDDGLIGWARLPIRSQSSWYQWVWKENSDDLKGMMQVTRNGGFVTIPMQKSLHFKTTSARNNPEGRSLLRNAYRSWYFKKHLEEIEGIGAERDLAGLPVLTSPEDVDIWNPDDEDAAALLEHSKKVIRNIRRDQQDGLVKPFGWGFDLLSSGGNKQIDTNAIINRYDQRMAVTLLADIVLLGAEKVGSFALSRVKESMLDTAIESHLESIAENINRYGIPRLLRLNPRFAGAKLPKLVPGKVQTPDLRELGRFIQVMSGARPGFLDGLTEDYLRSVAGLPTLDEVKGAKEYTPNEEEDAEENDEDGEEEEQNASNELS